MHTVSYSPTSRQTDPRSPTTPPAQPLPGITRRRFSLFRFRSPLLPESLLFSLPDGTEMFHFPSFPPHALYIQARVTALTYGRVPPFGHPRITARLTAPRGLSRPTTSFIGSWCQGIHRAPLKTWPQRCSHPLFRSQTPTGTPPPLRSHQPSHCDAVWTPGGDPVLKTTTSRLFLQDPTVCRTRTGPLREGASRSSLRCSTRERRHHHERMVNRTTLHPPTMRHDGRPASAGVER